jgi:hypothetical protein
MLVSATELTFNPIQTSAKQLALNKSQCRITWIIHQSSLTPGCLQMINVKQASRVNYTQMTEDNGIDND